MTRFRGPATSRSSLLIRVASLAAL